MSLRVLMRCSDEEFEKLIAMMDLESVIEIIAEIQQEMDREQESFDDLSLHLSKITDQSTAEFQRISNDLVKSQNKLALLMSRNMHCFKVQNQDVEEIIREPDIVTYKSRKDPSQTLKPQIIVTDINSNTPTEDNSKLQTSNSKSAANCQKSAQRADNSKTNSPQVVKKHKVVKVTRVVKRVVTPKSTNSNDEQSTNKTTANGSISHSLRTNTSKADDPLISTPKRDNIAETKTLTSAISSVKISTPNSKQSTPDSKTKRTLKVRTTAIAKDGQPEQVSPVGFPPSTLDLSSSESSSGFYTARSQFSPVVQQVNPQFKAQSSPRVPDIQSVLEMDIPETSIDGEMYTAQEDNTQTSREVDKISCTTDESGFTSASSDTDVTVAPPDVVFDYHSEDDEKVQERLFMKSWNPVKLLEELYALRLSKEPSTNDIEVVNMCGYLERLPVGKDKNTLLKTWKRTYCRTNDGIMYFYDSKKSETAQSFMSLMGGNVEEMANRMLGIDDMRGHYLMVRCPTDSDFMNWRRSFYTQIKCSPHTNYVRPALHSQPGETTPNVIIIDLGSTSVRAGKLGATPSYPELFFPNVSSLDKAGRHVFGYDAYQPDNRINGLHHPISSTKKIDTYRVNVQALPDLFKKIFTELKVDSSQYTVMLSTPHNFSNRLKEEIINILIDQYSVRAVNMVNQSLLTPYIYSATSGIVVDIGERIEIVAITDGYLVENGLNRQAFGGSRITDTLNSYLVQYRLFTPVEHLISRIIKEKACFMSQDYGEDLLKYMTDSTGCEVCVDLNMFDMPDGAHMKQITVDTARFKTPEGLMKTELIGVDSPTLPKLIEFAIQKCPMDVRREMWQSIYLSGGTTLIPGFAERLQKELHKLAPRSITVQVHGSPHRYHAAYIGANMLAKLPNFMDSCITREEWKQSGMSALSKWKRYFQG